VQAEVDGYTDPLLLVKPESHGCVTRAYLWSRSCTGSTPVETRNTQKWTVISPACVPQDEHRGSVSYLQKSTRLQRLCEQLLQLASMKVIGTGFPRTGTTSIKAALEQLGFGPCYHMQEVFKHPQHMSVWYAAAEGEKVDWVAFFEGWEATVDAPGSSVWRELLTAFPDALVLHSVLPPERWYSSFFQTVWTHTPIMYPKWVQALVPWTRKMTYMQQKLMFEDDFHGRFADHEYAISVFNKRIEQVSVSYTATLNRCNCMKQALRLHSIVALGNLTCRRATLKPMQLLRVYQLICSNDARSCLGILPMQ
jgi:Sulfotransferase domain